MRVASASYRINAGYFRDGGFRASGAILPYHDIVGEGGSVEGDRAAIGFLEARREAGFRCVSVRAEWMRLRIQWVCDLGGGGGGGGTRPPSPSLLSGLDANADVRDLEGEIVVAF